MEFDPYLEGVIWILCRHREQCLAIPSVVSLFSKVSNHLVILRTRLSEQWDIPVVARLTVPGIPTSYAWLGKET